MLELYPAATVSAMQLDLSSLASVEAFVQAYQSLNKPLHILINNAGIMGCDQGKTTDGFELQMGTNHVGHFHLTMQLLPLLRSSALDMPESERRPSRIVNLSSLANFIFAPAEGIDVEHNFDCEKHYDPYLRYGESKLANILFTKALQRRIARDESLNGAVQVVSVHPGVIIGTQLIRHLSFGIAFTATCTLLSSVPLSAWKALLAEPQKSIAQGSATSVRCALDPAIVPGEHYADCNQSLLLHPMANNEELQERLWETTEKRIAAAREAFAHK